MAGWRARAVVRRGPATTRDAVARSNQREMRVVILLMVFVGFLVFCCSVVVGLLRKNERRVVCKREVVVGLL